MTRSARRTWLSLAAVFCSAPTLVLAAWPQAVVAWRSYSLLGVPLLMWGGFLSLIVLGLVALIEIAADGSTPQESA